MTRGILLALWAASIAVVIMLGVQVKSFFNENSNLKLEIQAMEEYKRMYELSKEQLLLNKAILDNRNQTIQDLDSEVNKLNEELTNAYQNKDTKEWANTAIPDDIRSLLNK